MDFEKLLEKVGEIGFVEETTYPIAVVNGLPNAKLHEVIVFENGQKGEVFLLEREHIQVFLFSTDAPQVGSRVTRTDKFVSIGVGKGLLGSIIDPLGSPILESKLYQKPTEERLIDHATLKLQDRARIKVPFITGVTLVDMMIPLGKGQRQLVMGDRKTGKTGFLLSTIKNQVDQGAIAIYAAIGRKKSDIKKIQEFFDKENIRDKTIIIASTPFDSPSLIYITPYSAMTIAEYFRDQGQDVVIILDDLSTHAKFYREVSLLAKRFPGRDAYPGDIFYTHARLIERAGNFKHQSGRDVSITALPTVEIVEGDFTGYLATNLMGMTDGHIFFDSDAFYQGRRPAINISLSVTRVGRQTQSPVLGTINRELNSLLTLYDKMQSLSHFGAELRDAARNVLETGDMIYKFFEQSQNVALPLPVQLVFFSLLWLKPLDNPLVDDVALYRGNLLKAYQASNGSKKYFEDLVQTKTFNELLANIAKQQDQILALCGLQKPTKGSSKIPQQATVQVPQPVAQGASKQ